MTDTTNPNATAPTDPPTDPRPLEPERPSRTDYELMGRQLFEMAKTARDGIVKAAEALERIAKAAERIATRIDPR
jgi:hypothetical protein